MEFYIYKHPDWQMPTGFGIAGNTKKRFGGYNTGDPFRRYEPYYVLPTKHAKQIEDNIKLIFNCDHEWTMADAEAIKQEVLKLNSKLNRYE